MKPRNLLILAALLGSLALMAWLDGSAPSLSSVTVMEYAKDHGVSYSVYPESLVALMESNPETEEFVLDYPFRKIGPVDLSGYDPAEGVPLFLQWDRQWGYEPYGGDFVAVSGSGAMCLAMAGWYLSGGDDRFSPERVAAALDGAALGTGRRLISEGSRVLGLRATGLTLEREKLTAYLRSGEPIIALMGPGDFTSEACFVVLTGCREGTVTVRDPGSRVNSETVWDFDTIAAQVKSLWVIHPET